MHLFDVCVVQGSNELLGRTVFPPLVELSSNGDRTPKLLWYPIMQKGHRAGEALLAAELILKDKVRERSDPYSDAIDLLYLFYSLCPMCVKAERGTQALIALGHSFAPR